MDRESKEKIALAESYKKIYEQLRKALVDVLREESPDKVTKEMEAYLQTVPDQVKKYELIIPGMDAVEDFYSRWHMGEGGTEKQVNVADLIDDEVMADGRVYGASALPREKQKEMHLTLNIIKLKAAVLLRYKELGSYAVISFLQNCIYDIAKKLRSNNLEVPKKFQALAKLEEQKIKKVEEHEGVVYQTEEEAEQTLKKVLESLGPDLSKDSRSPSRAADDLDFQNKSKEALKKFVAEYGDDPHKYVMDLLGVNAKNELPYTL